MKQVVIENPVINSPFEEPKRHFRFAESVIHDQELKNRREQEVAFLLAKLTLEKYFRQDGAQNTEKTKIKL